MAHVQSFIIKNSLLKRTNSISKKASLKKFENTPILPNFNTEPFLNPVRSRNSSFKKFDILPLSVIITPDEVYDTYVEIDKNMLLDVEIYNSLIQKAKM